MLNMTVSEKQSQTAFLLHTINNEMENHLLSNIKSSATELQSKFTTAISANRSPFRPFLLSERPPSLPPSLKPQPVLALQNNEQTVKLG